MESLNYWFVAHPTACSQPIPEFAIDVGFLISNEIVCSAALGDLFGRADGGVV